MTISRIAPYRDRIPIFIGKPFSVVDTAISVNQPSSRPRHPNLISPATKTKTGARPVAGGDGDPEPPDRGGRRVQRAGDSDLHGAPASVLVPEHGHAAVSGRV